MPTPRVASSDREFSKRRLLIISSALVVLAIVVVWATNIFDPPQRNHFSEKPEIKNSKNIRSNVQKQEKSFLTTPNTVDSSIRTLWFFKSPTERFELMKSLQSYGANGSSSLHLLEEFLRHPDQAVRRAAMRGLASTQTPEAILLLQSYLSDNVTIEESTEAALALASMDNPSVTPILQTALEKTRGATLREHLVDALVSRRPSEVATFIDAFLQRSDVEPEEKQNLLRMTGLNSTKSADFLAGFVASNEEHLRHGAYQGLALISESRLTQRLIPKIQTEKDPADRALIYEALGNQLDADPVSLGALADVENDDHARLRALKAWTASAGRHGVLISSDPAALPRVGELKNAAINHPDVAERRVALFALGFVKNDALARTAIQQVAQDTKSEKIRALALGFLANPN